MTDIYFIEQQIADLQAIGFDNESICMNIKKLNPSKSNCLIERIVRSVATEDYNHA